MFSLLLLGSVLQLAPDSLTLDAALALAHDHRGQVTVAAAQTAAARADRRSALALPNPLVSYEYTGDAPRQHAIVEQPLDWLLRRGAEGAAGRADVTAAVADSAQILAQVDREVRSAFYTTLGATRGLALAEDEAAFADSVAAIAARQYAAGEISELQQAQAALDAARAHQLVSVSREDHRAALAELGRALGIDPDSLPPISGVLDSGIPDAALAPFAVEDVPLVRRALADSAAARARFRAVQLARIPFPSLHAGVEWNTPGEPDVGSTVVVGFSLPFPLWQSGGAPAAAARARATAAAARLRETRADAARLLQQVSTRVRETARRALVARDSIAPLAVRQRELAMVAFRAGETGIVPVLDALRAERQVARDLVTDLVAFQAAHAQWLELIGRSQ